MREGLSKFGSKALLGVAAYLLAAATACGNPQSERQDSGPAGSDAAGDAASGDAASCRRAEEDESRTASCAAESFAWDGQERAYIVCRPDPLPPGPLPVVLGFHGGGGNAERWRVQTGWDELAARHGFVVAFMQGCRDGVADCVAADGRYAWNVGKPGQPSNVDDQGYALEVLRRLEQVHDLSIDSGCLFATGHSLGGKFTYSLACAQPDLLTAIGPVSASPSDASCTQFGESSIFHVHGDEDENVPFHTGCCSSAQSTEANAAYLPGCEELPLCFNPNNWWPPVRSGEHPYATLTALDDMASAGLGCDQTLAVTDESAAATCYRYPGCRADLVAEACIVSETGHGLAGIVSALGLPSHLWERFRDHRPRR
jgi:poly(3-hydroxybutyrate) depolymerase